MTAPDYENTIRVNVNDLVRVRLTDKGRAIRDARWAELRVLTNGNIPVAPEPAEDGDGISEWLLWEFMRTFGPCMHNGADMPFDGSAVTLTRMK